jgi:hypothetical protein
MSRTRRLAAILAADVARYSRLMGAHEEGTHERLKAHLSELVEPKIGEHRGRTVKNTGDGLLVEFRSVVDAVRCVAEVQRHACAKRRNRSRSCCRRRRRSARREPWPRPRSALGVESSVRWPPTRVHVIVVRHSFRRVCAGSDGSTRPAAGGSEGRRLITAMATRLRMATGANDQRAACTDVCRPSATSTIERHGKPPINFDDHDQRAARPSMPPPITAIRSGAVNGSSSPASAPAPRVASTSPDP